MKKTLIIGSACLLLVLTGACTQSRIHPDPDVSEAYRIFLDNKKNPTPAKFFTDQYPLERYHDAAWALTGRRIPEADARKLMRTYIEQAKKDQKWSYVPPKVKIPAVCHAVKIDGHIEAAEWSNALTFNGQYPLGNLTRDPEHKPVIRMMWDKTNLYVAGEMKNDQYRKPGKMPYDADCLEIFIRIDAKLLLYWEVIVNFRNELLCNYRSVNYWGGFADHQLPLEAFPGLKYKGEVRNGIFYVEIAIPWRLIPGFNNVRGTDSPKAGESVMFSLIPVMTRADNRTYFYSTHPLMYGGHNIYGQMTGILVP